MIVSSGLESFIKTLHKVSVLGMQSMLQNWGTGVIGHAAVFGTKYKPKPYHIFFYNEMDSPVK